MNKLKTVDSKVLAILRECPETRYHFNIKETRKKGHDFKDYVCPDTMEFEKDYFKMGSRRISQQKKRRSGR